MSETPYDIDKLFDRIDEIEEFIRGIAEESPTYPNYDINECKFCHTSWTEDTYDEYLKNVEILKENPEAMQPNAIYRIAWEHHDDDCLWVRANQLLAS
jgi:hypothetical protein